MKKIMISLLILSLITLVGCNKGIERGLSENLYGSELDMANTISPIISAVCRDICNHSNYQEWDIGDDVWNVSNWADGSDLIYKKEIARKKDGNGYSSCSGLGNVYYCRCYKWEWIEKELYYHVVEDKPLKFERDDLVFSCGSEEELLIPYYKKDLANMGIGETKQYS